MTDLHHALEEERRIINAATAGPWASVGLRHMENPEAGMPLVASSTGFPAICVHSQDAEFIAHARTALPLRNAQVEMAWEIVELLEQSAATARAAGYGQSDATWARMQGMAFAYDDARTALRRAIEEAGA